MKNIKRNGIRALRNGLKQLLIPNPNNVKAISDYAILTLDSDISANGIQYLNWLKVLAPNDGSIRRALLCAIHSRRGHEAAVEMALCFKKSGSATDMSDSFLLEAVQFERASFPFTVPTQPSSFDMTGQWRRVFGADSFIGQRGGARSLRALEVYDGELYCGFGDNQAARHFVRKWDGEKWSLIADEHTWRELGFSGAISVGAFCSMNGKLFATISAQKFGPLRGELFSYDGTSWENVSQGLRKWPQLGERALNSMIVHKGWLYVGSYVGRSRQEPLSIYRFDGNTWEREVLQTSSLDVKFTASEVYEFAQYNGDLYAATSGFSLESGTVWRLTSSGWEMVGGLGLRNSWGVKATMFIEALAVYQGKLIVSFGPANTYRFRLFEILPAIWMFDGGGLSLLCR